MNLILNYKIILQCEKGETNIYLETRYSIIQMYL